MKAVTVGLVCHNEEQNIDYCFSSLLTKQNMQHIQQVIVVDNASTDQTLDRLRGWDVKYPGVLTIIPSEKNLLGNARQLIVESCETSLLFFTDADCAVPPNWISIHLFQMMGLSQKEDEVKSAGVCGPNRLPEHHNWQIAINLFLNSPLGHGRSPQAWIPKQIEEVDHLPTTNCCFRMDALRKTKGFRPELMTGEDAEIGHQLQALGYKMHLFPQPVVANESAKSLRDWLIRMYRFGGAQWAHSFKRTLILWLVFWTVLISTTLSFSPLLLILIGMVLIVGIGSALIIAESAFKKGGSPRLALQAGLYGTLSLATYVLGALFRISWPISRRI